MATNDIDKLREHLYKALDALADKENPMELARAKAISGVAQTIINSAMVEVKYAQATGQKASSFLEKPQELPPGITGMQVHKIR